MMAQKVGKIGKPCKDQNSLDIKRMKGPKLVNTFQTHLFIISWVSCCRALAVMYEQGRCPFFQQNISFECGALNILCRSDSSETVHSASCGCFPKTTASHVWAIFVQCAAPW